MIRSLVAGQSVHSTFMLRRKELRTRPGSGQTWLHVELGDASGRIRGSLWKNVRTLAPQLTPGHPVRVHGQVITWNQQPYLSIDTIHDDPDADPEQFVPHAPVDVDSLYENIIGLVETVKHPHLRQLLSRMFGHQAFRDSFCRAPGGKLWHHSYQGGLAEHTWSVLSLVLSVATLYSDLRTDLLIAGALLHDVGKIDEYTLDGFIEYSDTGRLHGHIALGYHRVAQEIATIDGFPRDLADHLLHLILAHQGQREHGSPVVPLSREALVLYLADEIDSKLNAFDRIARRDKDDNPTWSRYVTLLDRFLYLK
jgi:3'-5' exoribonuclease